MSIEVEDVSFIFGPNMGNLSKDEDFESPNSPYDTEDQANNIVRMFRKVQAREDAARTEEAKDDVAAKADRQQKR